ncbi:unnamed protein product [Gongylonema pulchrum]|uniref:Uncharacterized protein n=1 Tax=Gongylonema pulchrum TaxID=637853 RepID=A0A3P7M9G8_9BILA|nr:unnamed protein product [Gongylonema pulchrum]
MDNDSLRALFRRLYALNRCAIMKVENVVLRNHPKRFDINPVETDIDDDMTVSNYDDDDDQVAISKKWKYQRNSQTWSRIVYDDYATNALANNNLWSTPRQETSNFGYDQKKQSVGHEAYNIRNLHNAAAENNRNRCTTAPTSAAVAAAAATAAAAAANLQRSQSERLKERARAFMKRMDIRSSSRLMDRNVVNQ